jgi:hypothetical protein
MGCPVPPLGDHAIKNIDQKKINPVTIHDEEKEYDRSIDDERLQSTFQMVSPNPNKNPKTPYRDFLSVPDRTY